MTGQAKPRIGLFAAPETSPAVLFGLYDVLSTVGAVYPDMTTAVAGDALLDVMIVGATREPFRCFSNVLIEPHESIEDARSYDVVIVCDMYPPSRRRPTDALLARRSGSGSSTLMARSSARFAPDPCCLPKPAFLTGG